MLFLEPFNKVCNWKAYYTRRIDPCGNLGLLTRGSTSNTHLTKYIKYNDSQIGASSNSGDSESNMFESTTPPPRINAEGTQLLHCLFSSKKKPKPPHHGIPCKWGTERAPARGNCSLDTQWRNGHLKNVDPNHATIKNQQMWSVGLPPNHLYRSYSHQPLLWALQKTGGSIDAVSFVSSELYPLISRDKKAFVILFWNLKF